MAKDLSQTIGALATQFTQQSQNRYSLNISELLAPLSVLSVVGDEQLNQPWRYTLTFTSTDKHIRISSVLSKAASLSFLPQSLSQLATQISSLDKPDSGRTLYGGRGDRV